MTKLELFFAAMQAELYRRRAWVISAFSLIREGPDDWKRDPYPFRIIQTPVGFFFVDPADITNLIKITDVKAGQPLFQHKERVALKSGAIPNLFKDVDTTYGNILFNYTVLVYPFGNKVPYQEGRVSASKLEEMIVDRLVDNPADGSLFVPGIRATPNTMPIYVHEYLKFCDAMFYLPAFTQLWVPAATPKTMTGAPGIHELRNKLVEENKDRLHDPAVIAKIQAELVQFDRDYMKGDPGENFLIGKKSFEVVRSKLFGMHGAEVGLSEGVDVELIQNSLSEGWDINMFPAMNNSLRAGSFNRGAQTMLGGESVKWLLRASSNIAVTEKDCGSRMGNIFEATGENYNWLVGFSVVSEKGAILLDAESAKSYVGKKVMVRSPMFCRLKKTDYCECCVGERLAANPTALSAAISEYGSAFLGIYMAAAHGKALVLAEMNYKTAII